MKKGLVFSGQGTHRKGMGLDLVTSPKTAALWERMKDCMMRNFGIPLQDIISENPTKINIFEEAADVDAVTKLCCKSLRNTTESAPRTKTLSNPKGVMQLTSITQPCVLAAQMLTLEKLKECTDFAITDYTAVAGHSLGEFSALCAMDVFSPETALNLTFMRGLLMEKTFQDVSRDRHMMYACNPTRAKLHEDRETADDYFFILVELVARTLSTTTSFVEVANYNLMYEQYVVAGDLVGLSVLGKCLDPQFRANCPHGDTLDGIVRDALASVNLDKLDGITMQPNRLEERDFVTSAFKKYGKRAIFRRFVRGPDDGATPPLEKLSHLTLEEDGRSGLKKKSWYIPLHVEIPFHTSTLRACSDNLLPIVRTALPDEATLRSTLDIAADDKRERKRPQWITNLTGTAFSPLSPDYQQSVRDVIGSLNVGEVQHNGRYSSTLLLDTLEQAIKDESVRDICSVTLAAQLSHPVLWVEDMEEMVVKHQCREIHEIAPARNVSEMFRRSSFVDTQSGNEKVALTTKCFPVDARF